MAPTLSTSRLSSLNKIDTLDEELVAALASAELAEESGHPVMALSKASGEGVGPVLDKLLEIIGPKNAKVTPGLAKIATAKKRQIGRQSRNERAKRAL